MSYMLSAECYQLVGVCYELIGLCYTYLGLEHMTHAVCACFPDDPLQKQ